MQLILGFGALLLNLIGYIPYIRDIFRHIVKPHRYTWAIWTILVTIVFILSLKFGMGGASKIDKLCLMLAALLLIYWITTKDSHLSTIYAVAIDGIGAIPTLIKVYCHPKTETYIQWVLAGLAGILTLLAVPKFDFILIIYPLYVIVMNAAIVGIKFVKEK